jgi:hypothetical protein
MQIMSPDNRRIPFAATWRVTAQSIVSVRKLKMVAAMVSNPT